VVRQGQQSLSDIRPIVVILEVKPRLDLNIKILARVVH
jgi:hypothetical protein